MLSQTDAVKQAWAATNRALDIIVTVDGKDYQATEINSLNYDAGAFTGDTLGIGSTYENSVTIEFSSVVEAFKQGLTVFPKVGILVNGKFEYTKLGTFIISEVNRDRNNNLTTIKALDQMCKLEGQYTPTVSATASPLDIIADIANQGGVTVNTGDLQHLPALPNIKKIEGQTLRTAIGWIAQLYDGFATFDRDGKLTIRTTASPDYTITPGEYQQGGLTKNEVAYKTGGIKVTVNTKKTDDSGQEVDDTTTLQAGETTGSQIELTNDSMTNDLLTMVWTRVKDITYYPYTLNWFGNPNLEAGDWVTLTDTQGNQFNVPVNQYTMSFNGGLESTISANQSSSTAGGYAYTGSAGSIKNMIEALQMRHTASGNNVYPPSYQGQPQNPKKGDVWYKQNGNSIEVWIYQEDGDTLSWVKAPIDGEVKAELQALGQKTNEDLIRVKSELSSEAESQWQSMKAATSEVANDLSATKANLEDTKNSLSTTVENLQKQTGQLSGSLDTANSMIMFNSNAIAEVKHTADEISTTVSNIQVGGRNLVLGTQKAKTIFGGTDDANRNDVTLESGYYWPDLQRVVLKEHLSNLGLTYDDTLTVTGNLTISKNGTLAKSDFANDFAVGLFRTTHNWLIRAKIGKEDLVDGQTTYKVKETFVIGDAWTSGGQENLGWLSPSPYYWLNMAPSGYSISVDHYQVEKGTMPTDWTPAPEDADQAISKVSQTADAIRADLTSAKGDISSVTQTANEVKTDLVNTKGDVAAVKTTAQGLTTRVSNAEGNISSVQETAEKLQATVGDDNTGLVSYVKAIPGQISSAITASKQAKVITSAVDVHNMTTAGYYLLKGTLTNSPVDAWAYLRVITSDSGDRIYHQLWKDVDSTVYTEYWAGAWSGWATHINSENLKSNVITAINQSTEGVSITGSKITLDGNVNVTPGFTLSADYIKAGTLSADRISGGTLNFSNITVKDLTANSISSGNISGQNLLINLDNGQVAFTKGSLHSTDGMFNIDLDNKSFKIQSNNDSGLWVDDNGFHYKLDSTSDLWINKDGFHSFTDSNQNGTWIKDGNLTNADVNGQGVTFQNGNVQFSSLPYWSSDNSKVYGSIYRDPNFLGSSDNGLIIEGIDGLTLKTSAAANNTWNANTDGPFLGTTNGAFLSLANDTSAPSVLYSASNLYLTGGPIYPDGNGWNAQPTLSIGTGEYYTHSDADMYIPAGTAKRGNSISIHARNLNVKAVDWINFEAKGGDGRIAFKANYIHLYPAYLKTTSSGANVFVAPDGALLRSTSAAKYKTDIHPANEFVDYGDKLINLTPKVWLDNAEVKRYKEDPAKNKKPGYYYGLIADELDQAGLNKLVTYGEDGQVEGIQYDRLAVALLPVLKSLKDQVASLKEQLKALTK